ncbi:MULTISPECIES: hypothetical protein [unclassified Deinococcus]|uniref:hypothetical protein n=1 Tax=unclassified Deinococcus TaxID=2623546 RepID=UPI001C30877A|nr:MULTISPECIES: hypothetical protein [unclassified Deinococcus]MDK2014463.1 hypothetical protein [Deinococcus sp. 43]
MTQDLRDTVTTLRLTRREAAKRLRALRASARLGNPKAVTRLTIYRLSGFQFPNPDRRASCLHAAERIEEHLTELRDDPTTPLTPDVLTCAQDRVQLYRHLADRAAH